MLAVAGKSLECHQQKPPFIWQKKWQARVLFDVRDVEKFVQWMNDIEVPCTPIHEEPWGRLVDITLPGGGALGIYQARHERPNSG